MNKALLSLTAFILLWSVSSCNLYRRIAGRKKPLPTVDSVNLVAQDSLHIIKDSAVVKPDLTAAAKPPFDSAQQVLLQNLLPLWNAQTVWNTFIGKAKVHYDAKGESQDFAATIRMEKGKSIWVSVTALGLFEAARVLIRPDTIFILERIHKEVRIMPFSESSSLMPVHADFASLQSLIIGDVLQTGHLPAIARDTAGAFMLAFISPEFTQSLQFDKADTSLRFQAIATQTASILCAYSNWTREGSRKFADNRDITMSDKGEPYGLSLEFSKAAFDEAVEMPFSVPDKYERK